MVLEDIVGDAGICLNTLLVSAVAVDTDRSVRRNDDTVSFDSATRNDYAGHTAFEFINDTLITNSIESFQLEDVAIPSVGERMENLTIPFCGQTLVDCILLVEDVLQKRETLDLLECSTPNVLSLFYR